MTDYKSEKDFDKLIDRELLITLVKQRPVLWNRFLDIYKAKNAKTKAWLDICRILYPNFDKMDTKDRNFFVKCTIKRWTRIRDAWVKTVSTNRKMKRSGPPSDIIKRYKYHKELMFLRRVVIPGDTEHDASASEQCDMTMDQDGPVDTQIHDQKEESDRLDINESRESVNVKEDVPFRNPPLKKRKHNDSRHLAFFKSILPSLRHFDDDQTLDFNSGVINLIQSIKRRPSSGSIPQYQYEYQNYSLKPAHSSAASLSSQPEPEETPSMNSIYIQPELSGESSDES